MIAGGASEIGKGRNDTELMRSSLLLPFPSSLSRLPLYRRSHIAFYTADCRGGVDGMPHERPIALCVVIPFTSLRRGALGPPHTALSLTNVTKDADGR